MLTLIVGIIFGIYGPRWIADLVTYFLNRQVIKEITPTQIDENRMCKGPHAWVSARSLTEFGISSVHVCRICGFIPKMDKMATLEAIDRIEENNKRRDLEEKIRQDFCAKEDEDIKKYFDAEIKNGVQFDKLAHIHNAGITFNARFNVYKSGRASEIEKVLRKNDA